MGSERLAFYYAIPSFRDAKELFCGPNPRGKAGLVLTPDRGRCCLTLPEFSHLST
jgi:hypothetical protein